MGLDFDDVSTPNDSLINNPPVFDPEPETTVLVYIPKKDIKNGESTLNFKSAEGKSPEKIERLRKEGRLGLADINTQKEVTGLRLQDGEKQKLFSPLKPTQINFKNAQGLWETYKTSKDFTIKKASDTDIRRINEFVDQLLKNMQNSQKEHDALKELNKKNKTEEHPKNILHPFHERKVTVETEKQKPITVNLIPVFKNTSHLFFCVKAMQESQNTADARKEKKQEEEIAEKKSFFITIAKTDALNFSIQKDNEKKMGG